jgi:dTDP-glucose 4,6-dehydratase
MKTVLLTGGCGFIGSHMAEHIIRKTDWDIVILDKLSYASFGLERLRDSGILYSKRVKVFTFDLVSSIPDFLNKEIGDINYIIHMCAETHVDNSIDNPVFCIQNNINSTLTILEYARSLKNLEKFFYFSTDETYGSAPKNVFYKEWDTHRPSNPYSASKSACEQICFSYFNTYKIPLIIINCMNAIGERQHVEKFFPKCIKYILENKEIDIHCDENGIIGSRFYIHARNISDAVLFLIEKGDIGEKYNIVGEKEVNNLEMLKMIYNIIKETSKDEVRELKFKLVSDIKQRPGHDLRYALDGTKMRSIGWNIPVPFEESLKKTVCWTLKNKKWLITKLNL